MNSLDALARTLQLVDEAFHEISPVEDLRLRNGKILPGMRPGYVIVKAIETSGLTLTEMLRIMEALSKRVGSCLREYPELEETACDLEMTCKNFLEAQDKIDERLWTTRTSNGLPE